MTWKMNIFVVISHWYSDFIGHLQADLGWQTPKLTLRRDIEHLNAPLVLICFPIAWRANSEQVWVCGEFTPERWHSNEFSFKNGQQAD